MVECRGVIGFPGPPRGASSTPKEATEFRPELAVTFQHYPSEIKFVRRFLRFFPRKITLLFYPVVRIKNNPANLFPSFWSKSTKIDFNFDDIIIIIVSIIIVVIIIIIIIQFNYPRVGFAFFYLYPKLIS